MTRASTKEGKGGFVLTGRLGYGLALLLLLLSAWLRMADLSTAPPGISDDEIINMRLVDNVRRGDIYVFYPGEDGGREGMYLVAASLVTSFTGEGTIGYRILSVWMSLLAIAMVYALARHLFNPVAALLAMSMLALNLSNNLLARAISSDAAVIFFVSAIMLALARAMPVYRSSRAVSVNIITFTALGALLGISLYMHPSSLFAVLASLVYIGYLLFVRKAVLRQRRGYIGFAVLIMLIIAMPYLISSINLPQYAALRRLFQYADGFLTSAAVSLLSIGGPGDLDPLHNLPGRPLVDVFSGLLILVGVVSCLRNRRRPQFMLLLIMCFLTAPAAFLVESSPDFSQFAVVMPQLALFFGIGAVYVLRRIIVIDVVFRRMAIAGMLALLAFNFLWTWQDLFVDWRSSPAVAPRVNGELGAVAHHLDLTGADIPTVLCNPNWSSSQPEAALSDSDTTRLMMNRVDFEYREADCRRSLILTDGGGAQQIVLFRQEALDDVHPYLRDWLSLGRSAPPPAPRDAIITLETSEILADTAGGFITTAPVAYAPEAAGALEPISPPIRFAHNLTFLGYQPDVERTYLPGERVDVITYWRVEGALPPDLTLFTHILSDPVTIIASRDVIHVHPGRMQARDVFVHVTRVQLPETALASEYLISVGAYMKSAAEKPRLSVLQAGEPFGDDIFLYSVEVLALPESEEDEG